MGCEGGGAAAGGGDRASAVHRLLDGAAGAAGRGVACEGAGPGGGAHGVGSGVKWLYENLNAQWVPRKVGLARRRSYRYRGTSLVRNVHPPSINIWPWPTVGS